MNINPLDEYYLRIRFDAIEKTHSNTILGINYINYAMPNQLDKANKRV